MSEEQDTKVCVPIYAKYQKLFFRETGGVEASKTRPEPKPQHLEW